MSSDDEYDYDTCYGSSTALVGTFIMAGNSSEWWNYEVHFDKDGEQEEVYIVNGNGKFKQKGVLFYHEENGDRLLLRDSDFEEEGWHMLYHCVERYWT